MFFVLGLGVELLEIDVMNCFLRWLIDCLLDKGLFIKFFFWYGIIEFVLVMGGFFWVYYLCYGNFIFFVVNGILYREVIIMIFGVIIFS